MTTRFLLEFFRFNIISHDSIAGTEHKHVDEITLRKVADVSGESRLRGLSVHGVLALFVLAVLLASLH